MIKRPTNLTPKAPARLMPVRLSQNHQGAEKGLKNHKITVFSLASGATQIHKQQRKRVEVALGGLQCSIGRTLNSGGHGMAPEAGSSGMSGT